MKIDAEIETLPSVTGVFFTVLLLLIVIAYSMQKFQVVIYRKDYDIMMVDKTDFYAEDYVFNHE